MDNNTSNTKLVTHRGSCHCKAVTFRIEQFFETLTVWKCNCSICLMKQNHHFIVPEKNMVIETGQDVLTTYRFNTKIAQHLFCSICGVQPFYRPRSNPDGYGVTIYCLDKSTIKEIIWKEFDGENWEDAFGKSNISSLSK